MCVLDDVNVRSLAGFGWESFPWGPMHWIHGWELVYGIYPWVSTLVMGNLMGRRFWVGRGCFFLGGTGEGKRNSRVQLPRRFRRTTRVPNSPVYVIYYILHSGGFAAACLQTIAKAVLDPRLSWSDTCTVRPSPLIEDGEGVVDPRSTTSVICHMSVICPSPHITYDNI
jgi:hypothetical protein